ncbi:protocatechuate 3,4-dioxygenase subunit alpha [Nesterenkonia populi]|uniref:protocatechuate 3,4-dioxygenase subunit alpha n=1 Tax=Nesterenkonia populi TaxID=1591087 RepID=UPI0011BF1A55|nr:protocatechuate 3,4-dioxygenase subunit alpha [Nesterenkonia populi]
MPDASLSLMPTPAQTIGPFYGYALPFDSGHELVHPARPGAIRFHGTVRDGVGSPVPDALIEIWQADAEGRIAQSPGSLKRDGYTFTGWGRTPVDDAGHFTFTTVNPGTAAAGKAPFIMVCVFARGLLDRLFTRAYLPEHSEALAADPLLAGLDAEHRETLIAEREPDGGLRFDIRLQGDGETVFLTYPRTPAPAGPEA